MLPKKVERSGAINIILFPYSGKDLEMTTVTYSIPNISCGHCVHTIQNELSDLEGVRSVSASQETKQATISYEPPASEESIKQLLASINYPVAG
jgi:copper chaperone CopZ